MTTLRLATLTAALAAFCLIVLPAGASADPTSTNVAADSTSATISAKKVRAQLRNCARVKRRAARRACLKQNQARRIAARQIAGFALVGARGDGAAVDWRHCANGRWLHSTETIHGRGISEGRSWRITHALVRRNGRWFDAVLSQPVQGGRMQVGIARRGQRWQVAVVSFDTKLSSYGNVTRTKITNRDCIKPA